MPVVFAPTDVSVSFSSSGGTPVAPTKIYVSEPAVNKPPVFLPK